MLPVHNPQRRALKSDIDVYPDPKVNEPDFSPSQETKRERNKSKPDDG